MDSSSRRAFALDSRAVWVEQQHRNQICLPRDNLPNGPADYSPNFIERHVSTPNLAGSRSHFAPFQSHLSVQTPLSNSGVKQSVTNKLARSLASTNPDGRASRTEFKTIFHDYDERQPLDPKLSFYNAPGASLTHESMLRARTFDGVREVGKVHFGRDDLPFGERNEYRKALPEYNVNYDSYHIRSKPHLGSISKSKRIYIPPPGEFAQQQREKAALTASMAPGDEELRRHKQTVQYTRGGHKNKFSNSERVRINLPVLKVRQPDKLIFDDTCYRRSSSTASKLQNPATTGDFDMRPSNVNKHAKIALFGDMLKIPRKHKSAPVVAAPLAMRSLEV